MPSAAGRDHAAVHQQLDGTLALAMISPI